jgi:beta-glucosidase
MDNRSDDRSDDRVEALLAELSLDERAALTAGVDMWHGAAVDRVGLPALRVTDGPVGARGVRWVGTTSACAPCGTALGATWDPELVGEVAAVLGAEARLKGADVLLAPTVNLHRNPLAGRNFECFSEDPHLTARLAVAYVRALQSTGVAACIKHFVANDSEFERHTISSEVGERVLRELYLVPFEAAVAEADVASVMSAYNKVNGTWCGEHPWLLQDVLKGEWGFEGPVISDWFGTNSAASAGAGLDLEMPGPPSYLGARSAERVRAGELDESVVTEQARRLLRLAERVGLLGSTPPDRTERSDDVAAHRDVLRRAAERSVVLLRNDPMAGDRPLLPLAEGTLERLAVIGPNAEDTAHLGGGSAAVNLHRRRSVLDGLRDRLGSSVDVVHERGLDATRTAHPLPERLCRPARPEHGATGLTVEYYGDRDRTGDPLRVERHPDGRLIWIDDDTVPGPEWGARILGTFVAEESGEHTFGLVTGGFGRLLLGGEVLADNFEDRQPGTAFFGLGSEEIRATVHLEAGDERELVVEYSSFEGLAAGGVLVGYVPPLAPDAFDRAVEAARAADLAVVVVGLNSDWETEGEDRASMALPGRQDELVQAVCAANPRTIVLVNAGSPVDLSCAVDAPALAQIWYPGQEGGDAVAALLVGDASPSGRLPTTLGRRVEDWPSWLNYPGEGGRVVYGEELFVGYRGFDERGTEPEFCFGHGLTYTTFAWGEPTLDRPAVGADELAAGATVTVRVPVTNTGDRPGVEVVQCYVTPAPAPVRRPRQELRGFARIELAPGASGEAVIELDLRAFARWRAAAADGSHAAGWFVDAGSHGLRLSRSSRDVVCSLAVEVTPPAER